MPAQSVTSADKVRQAQQARRKAALNSASRDQARRTPKAKNLKASSRTNTSSASVAPAPATPEHVVEPVTAVVETTQVDESASAQQMDQLCEWVEGNPSALGPDANSVRQLCRNRRQALSNKGKAASPGKRNGDGKRRSSKYSAVAAWMKGSVSGRDLARQRRKDIANEGRGDTPISRPSGRVRPKAAPSKVEVGTTLAGSAVTGTQVERTTFVTGNEPGTCSAITGTEYIGTEQFETYCGVKPEPNPAKVGMSATSSGMPVSGTEVGRSAIVTGDEPGTCANVTGSEYVGSERLAEFCGNNDFSVRPAKVNTSSTANKQVPVSGADEARVNGATGNEAGAKRPITGSQYADVGAAKMTINGPSKVALTHTIAGRPVTGTEVGRSAKVTGDEHGSCRPVTGTEYISNEQFSSVCQTAPVPSPAKVGVDRSRDGQRVTGNLVDRSEKVTGNELGSCNLVTGSQYGQSSLCGGAAPKAHSMQTLKGSALTGNRVDHGPKLSGDERGGCSPVTGTEYYGREQFAEFCGSTPPAQAPKVGVEHTPKGLHVSGTMVNHSEAVTGNDFGAQQAISGTPYSGAPVPENHGSCCDSCAARQVATAAGLIAPGSGVPVQIQQPVVAATPVVQAPPQAAPPAQQGFSITSPARAAQQSVTGSAFGGDQVTGPNNMATQLVSGTPEVRYNQPFETAAPMAQVPVPAQPIAAQETLAVPENRITGDGRDGGINITGANWGRSQQMTGTEGQWSQGRNPTLRGEPRGAVTNAHTNMQIERPAAVPTALVTGSSGSSNEGALITVSGGARG